MASDTRILRRRACNKKNILNSKSIEKLHDFDCNLGRCISSFKQAGKIACFTVGRNSNNSSRIAKKEAVRRRRLKRKDTSVGQDEVSRMQKKARYLLIKMKLEQNLIDAYSGDGWKGQSREKIKPEKELQRAQRQIMKCKLGIRDSIHHLDLLGSEGRIDDSVMHPDGSVFHEYIFCAKCKSREAFPDNDIILCDGNCNCGFHQKCLDPPLEKIPPGDQGWLCRICNCKVEILETLNAHLGTCFTVNDSWEEIFKEAVASSDTEGGCPNLAEDWPSDDSEDEDYCPDITNNTAEFEENVSQDACCSTDSIFSFDPSLNFISYSGSDKSCNETSRRQRRDVDYTKLYCEMFGKGPDELKESEDEDWGPYRKKKTRNASDIGIAPSDGKGKDIHEKMALPAKNSCNKRSFISILPNAIEAEVVNDPHRGSGISMENEGHRHILDEGASSDSSSLLPLASVFRLPRHKKRAHRAENTTRATFPVKKQEGTATTVVSTAFKVASQLTTNAMFLEKQTNATVKKLAAKNVSDEEELFLNEMQMICSLDRRLHYLKQRLLACKVNTEVQINLSGEDGDIVYVPVAEIKDKILR